MVKNILKCNFYQNCYNDFGKNEEIQQTQLNVRVFNSLKQHATKQVYFKGDNNLAIEQAFFKLSTHSWCDNMEERLCLSFIGIYCNRVSFEYFASLFRFHKITNAIKTHPLGTSNKSEV